MNLSETVSSIDKAFVPGYIERWPRRSNGGPEKMDLKLDKEREKIRVRADTELDTG